MLDTRKFRTGQLRTPVPLLALVAGLVALFGFGSNFGEAVVGRAAPVPHDHGRNGLGDTDDHGKGPGGLAIASQGTVPLELDEPGSYRAFADCRLLPDVPGISASWSAADRRVHRAGEVTRGHCR